MEETYILENRIRIARAEKSMTQADLARAAGVSRQTIGAIESQEYNPSVKLAFIIARCLEKEITDLFTLHGPYPEEVK